MYNEEQIPAFTELNNKPVAARLSLPWWFEQTGPNTLNVIGGTLKFPELQPRDMDMEECIKFMQNCNITDKKHSEILERAQKMYVQEIIRASITID